MLKALAAHASRTMHRIIRHRNLYERWQVLTACPLKQGVCNINNDLSCNILLPCYPDCSCDLHPTTLPWSCNYDNFSKCSCVCKPNPCSIFPAMFCRIASTFSWLLELILTMLRPVAINLSTSRRHTSPDPMMSIFLAS
jgi:hypothetical protein